MLGTHIQRTPVINIQRRLDVLGRVAIVKVHASIIDQNIQAVMLAFDGLGQALYALGISNIELRVFDMCFWRRGPEA